VPKMSDVIEDIEKMVCLIHVQLLELIDQEYDALLVQ